jgi:hypothetical protein
MSRTLFLPAVNQHQAERHFRRINHGEAPALDCYLSEGACRAHVSAFPPAFRENCKIWLVTERAGPDGRIVVALDQSHRTNVVQFRRPA